MVVFLVDALALAFAVSWVVVPTVVLVLLAKALREKPVPFDVANLTPCPGDEAATPVAPGGPRQAVLTP